MKKSASSHDVAILVVSCDRYADLWKPFFTLFFKHWPRCPYPVFLGSNTLTYPDARVLPLAIGSDPGWADGVRMMLRRIQTKFVLLMLEDFLVEEDVDDSSVVQALETMRDDAIACIRLGDANLFRRSAAAAEYAAATIEPMGWVRIQGQSRYAQIAPGTPYRVSTQVSIWQKNVLERLLIPGATAWEFEEVGSALAERTDVRFLIARQPVFVYDHAIEKGRWKPAGLAVCARDGLAPDLSARGVFSDAEIQAHLAEQIRSGDGAGLTLEVIQHMHAGRWGSALSCAIRLLLSHPRRVSTWRVLLASICGPTVFGAVRYLRMKWRVGRITSRHMRQRQLPKR